MPYSYRMTLYFIVHSTIGSTANSIPLYSFGHCRPICDPIWQNETEVAFWGIGVFFFFFFIE